MCCAGSTVIGGSWRGRSSTAAGYSTVGAAGKWSSVTAGFVRCPDGDCAKAFDSKGLGFRFECPGQTGVWLRGTRSMSCRIQSDFEQFGEIAVNEIDQVIDKLSERLNEENS